jgi:hypothetical protein
VRNIFSFIKKIIAELPNTTYNEDENYLELINKLTGKEINKILNIDYEELFAIIGNFVTIHVSSEEISGRNNSFDGNSFSKEDIKNYVEQLENYPKNKFEIKINIDKNKILQAKYNNIENKKIYLFFFKDKLKEWLEKINYIDLNKYFSKNNIILLLGDNINLSNKYFEIIGGKSLNDFEIETKEERKNLNYKIKKQKENCYYSLLSNLPPDIFYFSDTSFNNGIENWLIDYFNNTVLKLIFIFIANRIEKREEKYFIVIEGYKILKINMDKIDDMNIDLNIIKTSIDLYNWIYDVKVPDRIEIVRNVITRNLNSTKSNNLFEVFLNQVENIYNSSRSIFKTYIQDKMKAYFEERNNIELQVYDRIKDLDNEIKQLMKVLSNNILGVVGAILTVLLAYVTKNIPVGLIRIIMIASGIFIIINTIYYSIYIWKNRKHINDTYENFINHCKSILYENEIEKITGKDNEGNSIMDDKNKMFNWYFWINIFITAILAILLVYYGCNFELVVEVFNFTGEINL